MWRNVGMGCGICCTGCCPVWGFWMGNNFGIYRVVELAVSRRVGIILGFVGELES